MKFGRKPYLVRVENLDTASSEDVENKTAGLKAVRTEKDGFILQGLLHPSIFDKVIALNGLDSNISIVGSGNINVVTERTKSGGLIKIEGLPPTFYPSVKSATLRTKELWFNNESSKTVQNVLTLPFGITRVCDVQIVVSGKVRLEGIDSYTPSVVLNTNSYELQNIKSDTLCMAYLFYHIVKNPLLSLNLQVRANPSAERPGKIVFENVSMVLNTLPRA